MSNTKQHTDVDTNQHKQIMRNIQKRIQQKQAAKPRSNNPLRDAQLVYPVKPADIPYSISLYQHLDASRNKIPDYNRTPELGSIPLSRIPLIGSLFQTIQLRLHQIALFYMLRTQHHQQGINQHLLESIEQLTVENQKQQRRIIKLEEQLAALQPK